MHAAEVIAMGYRYPAPGSADDLAAAIELWTQGAVQRQLTRFLNEVRSLPIGKWEEIHTVTLDLSPLFVPYVGHVVWGENYRRGEFMSDLNLAMHEASVDLGGELPDHIAPVLRYLSVADKPQADLIQVLPGAVNTMVKTLSKAAPDNPYRHLLAATADFSNDFTAGFADILADGVPGGFRDGTDAPGTSRTELRLRRNGDGKASWTGVGQ